VEVPEAEVMEDLLRVQVSPLEGDTVAERPTVPVKPFRGATVTVPVIAVSGFALADMEGGWRVKSAFGTGAVTVSVIVAEDEDAPAGSPVIVRV
jgi:hypothetical protein